MSNEEILQLMKKASRSLQSALNLLEDGDNDFATARAYYAVFYAAKAALISQAINRSKHSGVIAAFGQFLVKTGRFKPEMQPLLQAAFEDRNESDYGSVFPDRDKVEQQIENARSFIQAVEGFIKAEGISE